MTAAEWRAIPGFPDYRISADGRAMSQRCARPRQVFGHDNGKGYRQLVLRRPDGTAAQLTIHRLVALAFIGEPPEGMQVRHLDGDKSNNTVANLCYGTASENMHDQVRHGDHANARKTHCRRGHPFDEVNTYVTPSSGGRLCRTCRRANTADRRARTP